jgi:hypothetical protein
MPAPASIAHRLRETLVVAERAVEEVVDIVRLKDLESLVKADRRLQELKAELKAEFDSLESEVERVRDLLRVKALVLREERAARLDEPLHKRRRGSDSSTPSRPTGVSRFQ